MSEGCDLKYRISTLEPGYFALVMATGIVALALNVQGLASWALALTFINALAYGWLLLLSVLRVVFYCGNFVADLVNAQKGVAVLTFVAASGVLSLQFLQIFYYPLLH